MMFNERETIGIEDAKNTLKSLIEHRKLLWNGITRNVVFAGGFFTSFLQNDKFKDIDIFILDNDVAVYNDLTQGFKEQCDRINNPVAAPVNAIFDPPVAESEWSRSEMMSYMHNKNIVDVINNHKTQAQYILTKYKTREELLEHFDFKHCKVSYSPKEDKLYINRETFDCIKNKILKINNKSDSKYQAYRMSNFIGKGWVLETANDPKAEADRDYIMNQYQKMREEMAAQILQNQAIGAGLAPATYTISKDQMKEAGITAQTVEDALNNMVR